jgi:hypothetical protein
MKFKPIDSAPKDLTLMYERKGWLVYWAKTCGGKPLPFGYEFTTLKSELERHKRERRARMRKSGRAITWNKWFVRPVDGHRV